jgi:hypothetical protein
VEAQEECAPLQRRFVEQMPWRYELMRPLVLLPTGTAPQRAQETGTPPARSGRANAASSARGGLGACPACPQRAASVLAGTSHPPWGRSWRGSKPWTLGCTTAHWSASSGGRVGPAWLSRRCKPFGSRARRRRPVNARLGLITVTLSASKPGARSLNSRRQAGRNAVSVASCMSRARPCTPGSNALRPKPGRGERTRGARRERPPGRSGYRCCSRSLIARSRLPMPAASGGGVCWDAPLFPSVRWGGSWP